MSCEGPFFKVKHFPGSLAQPSAAAWKRCGCGAHTATGEAAAHTAFQKPSALLSLFPGACGKPPPAADLWMQSRGGHGLGVPAQRNLQMCGPESCPFTDEKTEEGLASPSCQGPWTLTQLWLPQGATQGQAHSRCRVNAARSKWARAAEQSVTAMDREPQPQDLGS